MKPGIPWSVKGIGPEARDAAKAAARQSGMTVGEWLNSVILDQPDDRPRQTSRAYPRREAGSGAIHDRLSSLAEQLEQLSGRQQETAVGQYFEGQRPQSRDRASLETVLARLEANERHTIEAFESIHERLAGLDQQVAQPRTAPAPADDGSSALAAVETALRNIVDHIETSERRTHEAFHSLQARVSEVADRTRREETSGNTTDPHVLARLDSRLSLLAERIEEVHQSSAGVAERAQSAAAQAARGELRDIEVRIEQLLSQAQIAMRQTAGASGDLTKVRSEIGSLAQRLDDIKIEAASERDVHALRLAVEQLSNQVAQNTVARPIAEFDRRLAELAHRLEQSQTQPAVLHQIEELEQRMLGLDQHLSEAVRRERDGEALGMLER
ncbi:MAG: hypothetical protein M3N38_11890, partial [Pseudomonadota bacterium]|nr:hypothetical protein [Pseudomonadota bacterium]